MTPWERTMFDLEPRPGQMTLLSGYKEHGKSTFISFMVARLLQQGIRICWLSTAMSAPRLIWVLCRQILATNLPTDDEARSVIQAYSDRLVVLNPAPRWQGALNTFDQAWGESDCQLFIVDNLDGICMSTQEKTEVARAFSSFAHLKNRSVLVVNQTRKDLGDGTIPELTDIDGPPALLDASTSIFTLWRNKVKERLLGDEVKLSISHEESYRTIRSNPDFVLTRHAPCYRMDSDDGTLSVGLWEEPVSRQFLVHPDHRRMPLFPPDAPEEAT